MGGIVAKRIGELLVEAGVLSQSQLEQALFAQRKDGRKLGQLLIELGLATEVQLTQTLSRQLSVPWVSLYLVDFSRSLLNLVPRAVAEQFCLIPIFVRSVRKLGETLYVAMDDPTNEAAIAEVAQAAALPVKPMIACPTDIRAAIRVYYLGEDAGHPRAASAPEVVPSPPAVVPPAPEVVPPPAAAPPPSPAKAVAGPATPPEPARPPDVRPPESGRVASVQPAVPGERAAAGPQGRDDAKTASPPRRGRPRMISLTLLDGTTISIPGPPKRQGSRPEIGTARSQATEGMSDQLTARDLVSALRALSHGADASDILGTEPKWEAMFSALLSILLRKGLIADWEFVEEFRKI
jgi:type IV pilus assembly protein PilB